jgi:hypothetical protein
MLKAEPPANFREMFGAAKVALCSLIGVALTISSADRRYIEEAADFYDARLSGCEKASSERPLPPEALAAYQFLTEVIASPALDDDALLAWVDAFPEAVIELGRHWDVA